jgi:hypothetical protein
VREQAWAGARRAALAALGGALASAALAASSAPRTHSYLRVDGVLGASVDPAHLGWFDVVSWTPLAPLPDGRFAARIRIVGAPPQDLAAAVSARRKLHEALLQDVQVAGGAPVRNVSFWQFEITGLDAGKPPVQSYAVTFKARRAVCDDYAPAPAGGSPCAVLKPPRKG